MKLTSPMQRYISRVQPMNEKGETIDNDKYESYTTDDLNAK